jgi:hydroxyethylthiazole kinase
MEESLWRSILSVRNNSPLVHNVTNYVVMNNTANALLAIGASPIMSHGHRELEEMVSISDALVINIGTLDEYWFKSMSISAKKASEVKKPWILDPVGVGSTAYRTNAIAELIQYKPSVIRGNATEIIALAGADVQTKGVDSVHSSVNAIEAGAILHRKTGSVICISGEVDIIQNANKRAFIRNGHPMMRKVTGLGCTASAMIGAFMGSEPDNIFHSTIAAMSLLAIAGEIAQRYSPGPSSLQMHLLDKLYSITEPEFYQYLNVQLQHG